MTLGERMKQYEYVERKYLYSKLPIIVRIDGVHMHSTIAQWKKPFDDLMIRAMNETAKYLCENIQGAKLAYIQSDEISILIHNLDTLEAQLPYAGNLQKLVSVSASMASLRFNQVLQDFIKDMDGTDMGLIYSKILKEWNFSEDNLVDEVVDNYWKYNQEVYFDARAFNIPIEEVNNYFLWRQRDCEKNSVQSLARTVFSHKQLENLNGNQMQNKMLTEKNINWNNYPTFFKRGRCITKQIMRPLENYDSVLDAVSDKLNGDNLEKSNFWEIDNEIPIFSENTNYIGGLLK